MLPTMVPSGVEYVSQSVEDVGRFLREEVRLPENIVGPKVKELRERGGVSISNVLLGPHDLRRLGIG